MPLLLLVKELVEGCRDESAEVNPRCSGAPTPCVRNVHRPKNAHRPLSLSQNTKDNSAARCLQWKIPFSSCPFFDSPMPDSQFPRIFMLKPSNLQFRFRFSFVLDLDFSSCLSLLTHCYDELHILSNGQCLKV